MPKWKTMDYKSGRSDVLFFFVYSNKKGGTGMDPRDADLLFNNILFTLYLFVLYMELNFTNKKKDIEKSSSISVIYD